MENNPTASHAHSVFASLHRRKTTDSNNNNNSASAKSAEIRDAASRDARRHLLQVVRNDWTFEPDSSTTSPPLTSSIPAERLCDVREWVAREQDTSDSEADNATFRKDDSKFNPYRFDSPDAVELSLVERKRKRRKLIQEEMEWNEGLRLWMQRRDAWTGAKITSPPPSASPSVSPSASASPGLDVNLERKVSRKSTSSDGSRAGSYNGSNDTDIIDATSQSSVQPDHTHPKNEDGDATSDRPALTDSPTPTPASSSKDPDPLSEPLIPILPPILPDTNPIRASINPAVYTAIYSRLVIQSHAPAVPINLSHMTRALVQGWKADGEWPPRPTVSKDVPVIKRSRAKAARDQITNDKKNAAKKSGVSGVSNAVKKVLGLSSFHPGHRLHIRANSQNGSASAARVPDDTTAKF